MTDTPTYDLLARIVNETKCKPGWDFEVVDNGGGALVLHITIDGVNNYDHSQRFVVTHCHPVPAASYNDATWKRWILEQCIRTMNHELGESLRFGPNEERPFAPMHGPGEDPYTIHEYRPEVDFLKTQRGTLREGPM